MADKLDQILFGNQETAANTPSSDKLDQILFGGGQEQAQQDQLALPESQPKKSSPLGLVQRARLSFADDPGREAILKEQFQFVERMPDGKFAVGNDPKNIQPVDPAGFEIIGDLADIVAEIPVIAGQIIGAGAGAAAEIPSGPIPTTLLGAGAGAAGGQAVKQGIGRILGVRQQKAEEEATDIAITGAFGALGQGAASALGKVSKLGKNAIIKRVGNMMENAKAKSAGNPQELSKVGGGIAKAFKISANVNPEATEIALKKGPSTVFTKSNLNEKNVLKIVDSVMDDVAKTRTQLGTAVNRATNELVKKTRGREVIQTDDIFQRLTADLKDIGLLGKGNVVNKAFRSEGADKGVFTSLLNQIARPVSIRGQKLGQFGRPAGRQTITQFIRPDRNITAREALILRNQFSGIVDRLSPRGQAIMVKFLRGDQGAPGLATKIADVAQQAGATRFTAANQAFNNFVNPIDDLRLSGVDLTKQASIQNFVKRFLDEGPVSKRLLSQLDSQTPFPILDRIENFAAAQNFVSANPNLLRLGAVASLLGIGSLDVPGAKPLALGAAVLFGSPAGARFLLRRGEAIGKAFTSVPKTARQATRDVTDRQVAAVLSQLARGKFETKEQSQQ